MNVVVPSTPDPDHPNRGLVINRNGIWCAYWQEDGRQVRRSLRTRSVTEARRLRDTLFRSLVEEGAAVMSGKDEAVIARLRANPSDRHTYIYDHPRFKVVVRGTYVGYARTRDEAVRIRNKHLGLDESKKLN